MKRLSALGVFGLGLCFPLLGGTPNPYTVDYERSPPVDYYRQYKEQKAAHALQEKFRKRIAIPEATGDHVKRASVSRPKPIPESVQAQSPILPGIGQSLLLGFLSLVAIGLALKKFAPELLDGIHVKSNPHSLIEVPTDRFCATVRAEEAAFSEFLAVFQSDSHWRIRANSTNLPASAPERPKPVEVNERSAVSDAVTMFRERLAGLLTVQRRLLQDIVRATDTHLRQTMLGSLFRQMRALKEEAGYPELRPLRQVASALEGLLKQLNDRAANVTGSTLRTVAGGMDLMDEMRLASLPADLLTNGSLKFLAVDDDPISRHAISLALKRVLGAPDLAEDGESGLRLAEKQTYDVIFLDVQMPGMDGFELCSRIHDTAANRSTPVVFVTNQSDFDARAKSNLSGGSDLIGKPFLTFEIIVKAMTLALRRQTDRRGQSTDQTARRETPASESPARSNSRPADQNVSKLNDTPDAGGEKSDNSTNATRTSVRGQRDGKGSDSTEQPSTSSPQAMRRSPSLLKELVEPQKESTLVKELVPEKLVSAFLARASVQLDSIREMVRAILRAQEVEPRQDMLAELYLRIHSLTPQTNIRVRHPAVQMNDALEGLLKKLLEDPHNSTTSRLNTLASGVTLLADLCTGELNLDLVGDQAIRILVVDDDPIARRALACALQMAFERPESAESGEAALELASKRPFDVVFLDVMMPGMDGYTTCSRLRDTISNCATPVVFVSSLNDSEARARMKDSGGNDFVGKPFLTSEITVKALTYALRNRLQSAQPITTLPSATGPVTEAPALCQGAA